MRFVFYYAVGANCCERVRWALDYKQLDYSLVDVGRDPDNENFRHISPFGRVPVIEVDGVPLSESMALLEFLEEVAPEPALNYADPTGRARVREVCEAVNASIHPIHNSSVIRHFHANWSKDDMRPFRADWISSNLSKLESRLWLDGPFVVGDRFSLADILVSVIFNKGLELGMDVAALPRFQEHWQHLMTIDRIRGCCPLKRASSQPTSTQV